MRARCLESPGGPLVCREVERPSPAPGQVLVKVTACAVCRTDLHVLEGELPHPKLPLIPGHEILPLAASIPVRVETQSFPLEAANEALAMLRAGRLSGAAVLVPQPNLP